MYSSTGRLQLFFSSPIEAGATLACLLPWAYFLYRNVAFRRGRLICVCAASLPILLLIALVFTRSRGPLVAMGAGIAVVVLCPARIIPGNPKLTRREGMIGATLLAVATVTTPVGNRFANGIAGIDPSVSQRWSIWLSSLRMLRLRPWNGIGGGEAGYCYSQWYEPDSFDYVYTGLFNNPLQLGVEYGAIAMTIYLAFFFAIFASPSAGRRAYLLPGSQYTRELARGCAYLTVVIFFLCSFTSSYFKPSVTLVIAASSILLFCILSWHLRLTLVRLGAIASGLVGVSIAFVVLVVGNPDGQHIELLPNSIVRISIDDASRQGDRALVLVDRPRR